MQQLESQKLGPILLHDMDIVQAKDNTSFGRNDPKSCREIRSKSINIQVVPYLADTFQPILGPARNFLSLRDVSWFAFKRYSLCW